MRYKILSIITTISKHPCADLHWYLNILPESQPLAMRLRLFLNAVNWCSARGFVKMSDTWSYEDMNRMSNSFLATLSLTKWKSTSTSFILPWNTRLALRYVAPKLSHHNMGILLSHTSSSHNRDCIHMIFATAFAKALYSASVLDLETVGCFLTLQEIKFDP
jgi:hypothetical protein